MTDRKRNEGAKGERRLYGGGDARDEKRKRGREERKSFVGF